MDTSPHTFVATDALTMRVREGGRVFKVAPMVATGVNADGHREVLDVAVPPGSPGPAWLGFSGTRSPGPGLGGVRLVTSDARTGLVESIGATLPGASWQRCRTHFAANLSRGRHTPTKP